MTERTTSSSWALSIVQALESAGIDCRQLFIELHLDYAALDDPDARFAQDDMTRLWQRAVAVSGDPAIGLNMARQARPAALNVVGYALMSSRNLKEGFARLVRYQRIIAEGADLDFQPCAQGYRLSLTIIGDRLPPARQSAEGSLAGCLTFCRWLTGTPLLPLEVSFQGRPPDDLEPYRQLFQAPLRFDAPRYALLFREEDVEMPLPTANEALAQLHDRFAGEYLSRFSDSKVMHRARQILCRLLPQGEPRREVVAQALCLSERPATAFAGGGQQLPAIARRYASRSGGAASGPAGPGAAGNRLSAWLRRSEQFLPGVQALVRRHARRIPSGRALTPVGTCESPHSLS